MKPSLKRKLKNAPFVIDWDKGEMYYQIHVFEDADGLNYFQVSSKINKEGKIEVYLRTSKAGFPLNATVAKPATKEEFEKMIGFLKSNLEKAGYIHGFLDLSRCHDPAEVMQLLVKSNPRFRVEIKHKSDI